MFHQVRDVDVMQLVTEVYNSVNRYFSLLSHTGYKSYNDVYKLLAFTFIEEMLYGPMSEYIDDKDYNDITDALYCLYGTCMIPYPDYKESFDNVVNRIPDNYRITEDNITRYTEDNKLRIES